MPQTISSTVFAEKLKSGQKPQVIDVRTPVECRSLRLQEGCVHIPLDEISADKVRSALKDPNQPFYLLCAAGKRARSAAEKLEAEGLSGGIVIEGGINACVTCGANVARGEGLSLERQVRIAAGAFVLLGIVLGLTVSPAFNLLAGLVGAGLVFSGLSGWCGLALLLAKAPWNK